MLTSAQLKEPWYKRVYFLKVHMCVYLGAKFEVSSIILTRFRRGEGEGGGGRGGTMSHTLTHKHTHTHKNTLKQTPKKLTQIRVKPIDSLILKSKFFYSKTKSFHDLTSFQRERTSFLGNFTHTQSNEKNYMFENKLRGFLFC